MFTPHRTTRRIVNLRCKGRGSWRVQHAARHHGIIRHHHTSIIMQHVGRARALPRYTIILRDIHPCSQTQTGGLAVRGECRAPHRELAHDERHSWKSSGHGVLSSWWSAIRHVRELAERHWFSAPEVETPGLIEQVVQPRLINLQ